MSDSSLVPERQLVFSPGLAATIGLEEAVLLQHLRAQFDHHTARHQDGYAWLAVERELLLRTLPFWNREDLHRVSRSLVDKGVLLIDSPPLLRSERLVFALNEPLRECRAAAPARPLAPPIRRSAGPLPRHWSPGEHLLQLLELNHNIPRRFALDQLEDFIFYWRERGESSHAWENKFRQHVLSLWRRRQQDRAEAFCPPEKTELDNSWQPSHEALEIMLRTGVSRDFIERAIPEFVLYWRERGAAPKELNSKFIQHIRIQWSKYSSSLEHSTEARRIAADWQPTGDVLDILRLSHIDEEFALSLLPEFIVYWKDSNQAHTSWNSKFIQHVKYHWQKRHQPAQTDPANAAQQGSPPEGRTRERSLEDDLTDTSWAD
ncbi:MAG: hypothetical protein KDI01_09590 [Halioglobus sp.]|nr:hypothetical protein [Halioglobus sp.]